MTVHMPKRTLRAFGAGGGKSGGGGKEAKNTLLSNATANLLDVIACGPIKGLVDGEKSLFLDGVPLENADESKNFKGIVYEYRLGAEDQEPISLFGDTDSESGVNVQVTASGGPITRTLIEENLDGFRVRIRIPSLIKFKDNGDIVGNSVSYSILWAPAGSGSFQHITGSPFNLNGKNDSPYYKDHSFDPPTPGPWDVRIVRNSADEASTKNQSDLFYDALIGVIHQKFIYPYSAYVAWQVDAEQFGSSIPERTYEIYGKIVRVPTNYDPETHTYTGFWDGSWKLAWTDDPAWCLFDLYTDTIYGAGRPDSEIDVVALYRISKYCNEKVSDGFGGEEPRYTLNVCINTARDAYDLINDILSNFRGMFFWAGGQFSFSQDAPTDYTTLVTPANTENGFFSYTSSTDKSRANIAYVQYNNPNEQDKPDFEICNNNRDVVKRGPRITRTVAYGCRSPGQARRSGEWLLYTLFNDTELVSYTAGLDHDGVLPGQVVAIVDPLKSSQRAAAGRLVSFDPVTKKAKLDRPINLGAIPNGYQIAFTDKDRNIKYYPLQTFAIGSDEVEIVAAIPPTTLESHSVWTIYSADTGMRMYRVTSVTEKQGKRVVAALQYNPSKFDHVERDLALTPPPVNDFVGGDLKPPLYFSYTPAIIEQPGTQNRIDMLISWTYPRNEFRVTDFQLQMAQDEDGEAFTDLYIGREVSYTMQNVVPGMITALRVRSLGTGGANSPWITISNIELTSRNSPPLITGSFTTVSESYGQAIKVNLALARPNDFRSVEIWRSINNNFGEATLVGETTASYFTDTNLEGGRMYYYWVRIRVHTDNPSNEYSAFLGPVNTIALENAVSSPSLGQIGQDVRDVLNGLYDQMNQTQDLLTRLQESFQITTGTSAQLNRKVETQNASFTEQIVAISGDIAAVVEQTEELIATFGENLANGLVSFQAVAAPAGVNVRYAVLLKGSIGDTWKQSGFYIELYTELGVLKSRAGFQVGQFVIIDDDDETASPFVYEDGVLKLNLANIGVVTSGMLKSPDNKFRIDLTNRRLVIADNT